MQLFRSRLQSILDLMILRIRNEFIQCDNFLQFLLGAQLFRPAKHRRYAKQANASLLVFRSLISLELCRTLPNVNPNSLALRVLFVVDRERSS
jgi:hypothetical protein